MPCQKANTRGPSRAGGRATQIKRGSLTLLRPLNPNSKTHLSLSLVSPPVPPLFTQASLCWTIGWLPVPHPTCLDLDLRPSGDSASPLLSLSLSYLCEWCAEFCLLHLCSPSSSRSPWWRRGRVAQVCLVAPEVAQHLPGSIFFIYVDKLFLILNEGSLLCCSSWGFLHFLPVKGLFLVFPYPNRGSEDRGCKAPWDKFVMCDIGLYK